jgi:hypothetical protein
MMKLWPFKGWRHTVAVIVLVLALMFVLYTVPRWIWGTGLDLF